MVDGAADALGRGPGVTLGRGAGFGGGFHVGGEVGACFATTSSRPSDFRGNPSGRAKKKMR